MIDNIFTTFESLKTMDATGADQLKESFEKLLRCELIDQMGPAFKILKKYKNVENEILHADNIELNKEINKITNEISEAKGKQMKLNSMRPYDLRVDPKGRAALRINERGDVKGPVDGMGKIIKVIDSDLYSYFKKIRDHNFLDIESRKNPVSR